MDRFQNKIILRALNNEDKLTEWESDFINNLADKEEGYKLSDKQASILNRIQQKLDFNRG